MYYRALERNKIEGLGLEFNFQNKVKLSDMSKQELFWWINNIHIKNGKPIRPDKVSFQCNTDSSNVGWGCYDTSSGQVASGRWSGTECVQHINVLELLAIFYALQSLYSNKRNVHILFRCDNATAVTYINDIGGMASEVLDKLANKVWNWCIDNKNCRRTVLARQFEKVVTRVFYRV
jgi:hypothetical protein